MELKKARRILFWFRVTLTLSIIFAIIMAGTYIAGSLLKNSTYRQFTTISAATEIQQRKEVYKRAIRLDPANPEAYILLIDAYNEDGTFTRSESEEFLGLYNGNHQKLRMKDPGYPELHYRLGFLYLNGLEEGFTTRLRMALPFLETANQTIKPDDPYHFAVGCYYRIGIYYRDYIWDAAAANREITQAKMETLTEDVQATLSQLQNNDEPDAVYNYLGFCCSVCNLLYDQRDVLAVTVPQEKVHTILDLIYSSLPQSSQLQKEQTLILLEKLRSNEGTYRSMIARAYEREGS